jgi:hypothetical protein
MTIHRLLRHYFNFSVIRILLQVSTHNGEQIDGKRTTISSSELRIAAATLGNRDNLVNAAREAEATLDVSFKKIIVRLEVGVVRDGVFLVV